MPMRKIVVEHQQKMKKAVEFLRSELKSVRTGKASTALVENIKADFYGTATPLKQMATLATPQADAIVIKPFDPGSLKEIEKAIKNSDLSITPMVDGKMIRLSIPPLSEERRKQLATQAKQMGEQTKVSIRNTRREANKQLEKEEKNKVVTEDQRDEGKKQIDDIIKDCTNDVDSMIKAKTNEIMAE